MGERKW